MGRGGDSLLGPLISGKRRTEKKEIELAPETTKSLLFQPFEKQDSSLYKINPTPSALRRADVIAEEMRQGNFMAFLLILDEREIDINRYPAFRAIFDKLSASEVDKRLRHKKIPRRGKEAKLEREALQEVGAEVLAIKISQALQATEDMPVKEQADTLRKTAFVDDQFLAESVLRAKTKGPARQFYINALRRTNIENLNRSTLQFLTEKQNKEGGEVFEEILRRHAVRLLSSLSHDGLVKYELDYGCLRISYGGASTMHIKDKTTGHSLCGSREGFYPGTVSYGDWLDGPYRGDFKQCPKCLKAADQATLDRLNSERSDLATMMIDEEEQAKIVALAQDRQFASLVRSSLASGKNAKEIKSALDKKMAPRVADIIASAADKYDDGKNNIYFFGGGHLAWAHVQSKSKEKLRELGYSVPGSTWRYRHMKAVPGKINPDLLQRHDDILLKATTAEERRKFFRYRARAVVESDSDKKRVYTDKSLTILNRAVRRFIRKNS